MRLVVRTVADGAYTIADMDSDTVLPLVEALGNTEQEVIALQMDDSMVYLLRTNIVAIEVG